MGKGLLARLGLRATEQTALDTPPAGQRALFARPTGWIEKDPAGVERPLTTEPGRDGVPQARAAKWVYAGTAVAGLTAQAGGTTTLHDTTDFILGTESAKVVTPGSVGVQCGYYVAGGPTLPDMTGHDLVLLIKVTGHTNAADFKFWLSDSSSFTNYYRWNLSEAGNPFPHVGEAQWYMVTLPFGNAEVSGTAPNLADLDTWQLAVYDDGDPMTVQINGIGYAPRQQAFPRGVVSLRFDDLLDSTMLAAGIMAQYGMAGTAYAIAETLLNNASYGGYLTIEEARRLERVYGWTIASHAYSVAVHNQTSSQGGTGTAGYLAYTEAAQRADMRACREALLRLGFKAPNHFAWPQGAWDDASLRVAQELFSSNITLAHPHNETLPVADPARIRCWAPPNTVTGAQLTAEVDKAIAGGEWLIILFHNIVTTPSQAIDVSTAAFTTLIEYLAARPTTPVLPVDQVLAMPTVSITPVYETHTFSVTGALTTQTGKSRVYLEGDYQIESVRAAVNTAPTGAALTVDVNKNATTIYTGGTGRPSIAASGFTATGNNPAVRNFAAGDYLTVDIDAVGSTVAGSDLTVTIRLRKVS